MNYKQLLSLIIFTTFVIGIKAQSTTTGSLASTTDSTKTIQKKNLDTEESLKYIGSELFFQVKKRLHLTSEEEEKKALKTKEEKKKVKLNIFGITIER